MRKPDPNSLRQGLLKIMNELEVGQELAYDTTNRNFLTLSYCYQTLKKYNIQMMTKKFESHWADDRSLFYIKRVK